jgi:NAD(P)H dehydrogenase (quinone)
MILITGAAGKTGKAILRKVADEGGIVKAWVFRAEQIQEVEALGAKEVFVGDLRESSILRRAMQGVNSVYFICPNVHPDEVTIARGIIEAVAAIGVRQFVYHSVLHPQIEAMPHHWKKMRVEEQLFISGLPFTILQPAVYMQNILVNWDDIMETGSYPVPYAVDTRISMVDLEDVAIAAAKVLMDVNPEDDQPLHIGATYELVGTQAITPSEIAAILAKQLGHPVVAEKISVETWKSSVCNSGIGEYQINTLTKMFNYYDQYGFWGNSRVLSWLLNRPPTSLEAFVKHVVQARLQAS